MVCRCVFWAIVFLLLILSADSSDSDECKEQQKIFTNASKNGHPIDFVC